MYLPLYISAVASISALIKCIIGHKRPQWGEKVTLATSSFVGGKKVAGCIITFIEY
ncbi:MAG: hypothetical protein WAW16_08760 [Candidatus Cryosericum sp.]